MAVTKSRIQTEWEKGRCRIEDGIFFSNDEVILLSGSPMDGYVASTRVPISPLLAKSPEAWGKLFADPACRAERAGVIAIGGKSAYEGTGFLAMVTGSPGELIWCLQLNEAEQFVEVAFEGDHLLAVSDEYPFKNTWRIPIDNPEDLRVKSEHC